MKRLTAELFEQYAAARNGSRVPIRNAIVELWQPWLRAQCCDFCRMTGADYDDAWDAGVDALIRAVETFPGKRCAFSTWVRACCRNAMLNAANPRRPGQLPEQFDAVDKIDADHAGFAELLSGLTLEERFVVCLHCVEKWSYARIAAVMGEANPCVTAAVFRRAIDKLRATTL